MKRINRGLHIIILLCFSSLTWGQLQPLLDQFHLDGLAINPAFAGSQEALNVGLHSRNQWVGFNGAPVTNTLSVHSPLRNKSQNLGIILMTDKLGSQREIGLQLNYAYRFDLFNGKLSLGLSAGFTNISDDINSIISTDPGDLLLLDPMNRMTLPEFSTGAYYYDNKFYLGFSMPWFLSHYASDDQTSYRLGFNAREANYLLTSGYIFRVSEELELFPMFLLMSNPANSTHLDLQCNLIYMEKFWMGAGVRSNGGLNALVQLQINPQLRIGYSYGYELSELSSYQSGTHEIILQYNFRYLVDVFSPRYF